MKTLTLVGLGHGCDAPTCVNSDTLNFASRFGYATQVNRKTVVRGGLRPTPSASPKVRPVCGEILYACVNEHLVSCRRS
jgi:hypothetical protein